MSMTKLANLINPEVMGDMISAELEHGLKATGFIKVDTTLTGKAGNTVTIPTYAYIGMADDLAEGVEGTISQLTATDKDYTVKKAVKNVELTDESLLSGYGSPYDETVKQLRLSIQDKVDFDAVTALEAIKASTGKVITLTTDTIGYDDVVDALDEFDTEEQGGEYYLMISKPLAKALRKDPKFIDRDSLGDTILTTGVIGSVAGCKVVINKRLAETNAFILKNEALTAFLKRDTEIETDRNVLKKSTVVSVDKHYLVAIEDFSKIVKMTVTLPTP